MKLKGLLLASVPCALLLAHNSALAQTADQANGDAKTVQKPTAKTDDSAKDATVVVVSGYRASLKSAQAIKKNSDAILDAVVAEDIGKLPDNNANESLARLPGVQITRYSDEGNGIMVRGLPDVATTVNGRDISTAELRRVQLQDFPSGALAALEVYKSATADLLEPGLAGLINVRTRRPFDFKGFEIDGAVRETFNDEDKKYDPNGNFLITDRWQTPIGEIGALLNLSYTQQTYRDAVRWGDGWITGVGSSQTVSPASVGTNFRFPAGVGVYNDSGKRYRPSMNGTFQWKVSDNLQLYVDGLWQAYRATGAADWNEMYLNNGALTNVVLMPGSTDQVLSFTKTGGAPGDFYRSTFKGQTDTSQIAVGAVYTRPGFTASTDLAYTDSVYSSANWSLDSELTNPPTIDVTFHAKGGGAAFSAPGLNVSDPANYIWRGYYESIYKTSGDGIQWRGDIVKDVDWGIFKQVKAGLRYTDRDAELRNGNRYAWTLPLRMPLSSVPVGNLQLTQNTFRGGAQGFTDWLQPTVAGVQDNVTALRALAVQAEQQLVALNPTDGGYAATLAVWQKGLDYNPLWGFHARESTRTGYAQVRYETLLFGEPVDGDIGARVVNTVGTYSGISSVTWNGVTQSVPRSTHQDYVDVLPNLSMRIKPEDDIQVRLAITKTRTRPDFGQLNPALNISQNVKTATTPADAPDAYGSAGNPDLKPLTSTNYDLSLEYYPTKTSSASFAVFYRDVWGFIGNYTRQVQDPQYGLLQVSRPENAGKGKLQGAELNGQTFFDFLPGNWSGLGVQANLTYIDAKNALPSALMANPPMVKLPGVSTWSYNISLFYEKGKVSTRLSYNTRSPYINFYYQSTPIGPFTGEGSDSVSRLDYSYNYNLNKNLTINFDISNILAQPYHDFDYYAPGKTYPRDIRDEGRYYGLSLRYKLN